VPCGVERTAVVPVFVTGEKEKLLPLYQMLLMALATPLPKTKLFHLKVEAYSAKSSTL
jgi:hypothetical protein